MSNYRLLYEDLLDMERRARESGFLSFARECKAFRIDILVRYNSPIGYVPVC